MRGLRMTPMIRRATLWATVTTLCLRALTPPVAAARAPETVIHTSPNSGGVTARAAAAKVAMAAGVTGSTGIPTPGGVVLPGRGSVASH